MNARLIQLSRWLDLSGRLARWLRQLPPPTRERRLFGIVLLCFLAGTSLEGVLMPGVLVRRPLMDGRIVDARGGRQEGSAAESRLATHPLVSLMHALGLPDPSARDDALAAATAAHDLENAVTTAHVTTANQVAELETADRQFRKKFQATVGCSLETWHENHDLALLVARQTSVADALARIEANVLTPDAAEKLDRVLADVSKRMQSGSFTEIDRTTLADTSEAVSRKLRAFSELDNSLEHISLMLQAHQFTQSSLQERTTR